MENVVNNGQSAQFKIESTSSKVASMVIKALAITVAGVALAVFAGSMLLLGGFVVAPVVIPVATLKIAALVAGSTFVATNFALIIASIVKCCKKPAKQHAPNKPLPTPPEKPKERVAPTGEQGRGFTAKNVEMPSTDNV